MLCHSVTKAWVDSFHGVQGEKNRIEIWCVVVLKSVLGIPGIPAASLLCKRWVNEWAGSSRSELISLGSYSWKQTDVKDRKRIFQFFLFFSFLFMLTGIDAPVSFFQHCRNDGGVFFKDKHKKRKKLALQSRHTHTHTWCCNPIGFFIFFFFLLSPLCLTPAQAQNHTCRFERLFYLALVSYECWMLALSLSHSFFL